MNRSACTAPDCDGGFCWVSDRWARQTAGVSIEANEHAVDPEAWARYRAWLNTTFPCPSCRPEAHEQWLATRGGS